ncbi:hypothetical protein TSUD_155000 [Trifolium subterraneum]|uniref:MADS-box domain-containing protein n=1 Tax=Trifolium subterraneum TaxID=3900 RepID=A0A2Z6M082_TRISU|nr:hypothetical protein TSUD_155000 [Trifolium subterraneum]
MLTKYEQQKIEMTTKEFNAKDYFENKKNKVEADILSVRKKIVMNKYPTWGRCFNNLGREQLRGFIDIVDLKIQACNQRINMLKSMQQCDQKNFIQNTAKIQIVPPENVVSPQSSHPMKPLIDISEMKDFTDLIEWDDPMPQKNVFSSQSSQLDVMHNIPQMQHVPAPLKPIDNISDMIDFTDIDLIEWDDLMPQKNVSSSQSSQLDVMPNIPQMQPVHTPLKPIDNISDMINYTNLIELDDLMPQKNVFSLQSSQLDVMHSIPQMQYVHAPLKPLDNISLHQVSSTGQLGVFGKIDDLVDKSDQKWATQLVDFDNWAANNKLNEGDDWVKQSGVFVGKDMSFLSEIEQECAALDAFLQPRY